MVDTGVFVLFVAGVGVGGTEGRESFPFESESCVVSCSVDVLFAALPMLPVSAPLPVHKQPLPPTLGLASFLSARYVPHRCLPSHHIGTHDILPSISKRTFQISLRLKTLGCGRLGSVVCYQWGQYNHRNT